MMQLLGLKTRSYGRDFQISGIQGYPGLKKVGTAGTGCTGKQDDLRGRSVYFHIPYTFLRRNLRFILGVVRGIKLYFAALLPTDVPWAASREGTDKCLV